MISVQNLSKYFGPVMAIDRVSFEVDRGEVVGFLGPNGAGKTTTMRILTSYLPATSGVAKVAGFDVMTESMDVRRNIGYLPESVPLYPEMRVEEYLDFRAKLKGVPRKERTKRIEYCLDRCRVREVRRRLTGTLSKGYRQRVGLADAMIADPAILIMDEPTVGLDPIQIRETLALISELGESHTILLSTHILSEVEAICERVIIINAGRIGMMKSLVDVDTKSVLIVEVRGPVDQVLAALKALEGVTQVVVDSKGSGSAVFAVTTKDNRDLREAIAALVLEKGWSLLQLGYRRRTLEDAFFEVLREHNPLKDAIEARSGSGTTAIQDKSGRMAVKR
ncbi:MAG TPA: ATP-binding cassette domain-containing protein [Gemmataceae bacterium]|nr:ATP-binding cassette domain-containing protein [Gemmataceae bacterium]